MSLPTRSVFITLAQDFGMMRELKELAYYYDELKRFQRYQECNKEWQKAHGGDQFPNADRDVAKLEKKIKALLDNLYPTTPERG